MRYRALGLSMSRTLAHATPLLVVMPARSGGNAGNRACVELMGHFVHSGTASLIETSD
jgi:hypothetical protein